MNILIITEKILGTAATERALLYQFIGNLYHLPVHSTKAKHRNLINRYFSFAIHNKTCRPIV